MLNECTYSQQNQFRFVENMSKFSRILVRAKFESYAVTLNLKAVRLTMKICCVSSHSLVTLLQQLCMPYTFVAEQRRFAVST